MPQQQEPRALPELIKPEGFDELIPQTALEFVASEHLVLDRAGVRDAAGVLAARRRHLLEGAAPLLIDLPAGAGSPVSITATLTSLATGSETVDRVTVDIERVDIERVGIEWAVVEGVVGEPQSGAHDDRIDHWSLDLDHDGLIHQAMVTGDGAPQERITAQAQSHDADRWVVLRIVDAAGRVFTATAMVPRAGW